MIRETFEPGNSVQFTWVSSIAPDAEPVLKITGIAGTVVASITSISSTSTAYWAMYTMPSSQGVYLGEWYAEKTVVSTTYPFIKKFIFNVKSTLQSF